ncbi:MAG: helix-turn-helix transcriptional regulator [Anaerovorax sp.]|nr:helix-turn-helix transcriptional regulator [Anaerovorax sp.]
MIGLEYILQLYGMQHQELAEKLGIRKQNINLWVKEKQNISKKHLPALTEMFGVDESYFQKELTDVDKLVVQKEKLSRELKPEVVGYQMQLMIGENADLTQVPIYNNEVINGIEIEISKAKVIDDFREVVSTAIYDYEVNTFEQLNMLFKEYGDKPLIRDTIDALSYYFNVLPDWVGEAESEEFVADFIKLVERYYEDGNYYIENR